MSKYKVNVEEILSRVIEVDADSEDDAEEKVRAMYKEQKIILGVEDFQEVGFYI